jgi:hypothetical protein
MILKSGDKWKTDKNVVYKTSKTGNNIFRYDWKVMQFEIGDIRETDIENFNSVSIKLFYTAPPTPTTNTSSELELFVTEPCTALYDKKTQKFDFIEKPKGTDPMGYSNARIIGNYLVLEYVENTGYVYGTKLKKAETIDN